MEEALRDDGCLEAPGDAAPCECIAVDPSVVPRFVEVLARILVARALREEIAQNVAPRE